MALARIRASGGSIPGKGHENEDYGPHATSAVGVCPSAGVARAGLVPSRDSLFWTVVSESEGPKVRFSFSPPRATEAPASTTPELEEFPVEVFRGGSTHRQWRSENALAPT
jgi:hypothetical protein